MKCKLIVLAPLVALLVACGVDDPASFGYPYNPNASATPSGDPRIPYYGEWVWAVTFADQSARSGVISIVARSPDSASTLNTGAGLASLCSADLSTCPVKDDLGSIGTAVVAGQARLVAGQGSAAGTVRWAGTDSDGLVGSDLKGRAELSGVGVWQEGSAPQPIGFALIQVGASPSVTGAVKAALPVRQDLSPGAGATSDLQGQALAAASALADLR